MERNDTEKTKRGSRVSGLEINPRKDFDVLRTYPDWGIVREQRSHGKPISFRVLARWTRFVRNFYCAVGGQEGIGRVGGMKFYDMIKQPYNVRIMCHSRLRKWAYDNAYTLLLMAALFAVTWTVMLIYGITHAGQ